MQKEIKKTCMPFKNNEAYHTYKNEIRMKFGGDALIFYGYLIDLYNLSNEKMKRNEFCRGIGFL